ncbi:hypothetical protein ASF43_07700 [Pseudorhodoferax sp. Leaf267]|nr:hypothetical protein ASF43_07700 [Pseudorhodoferax sp. Leaf267]
MLALASAGGGIADFLRISGGLAVFAAIVFGVRKPAYAWLLRRQAHEGELSDMAFAAMLIGLFACAMVAEWLHLHATVGAFMVGICLPRDDRLLHALEARIKPLAVVVLLPVFFALAGLGTSADAFAGAGLGALALILAVAMLGKIVGGAAGARMAGHDWRDSLATGSLMKARGLMELIVIKIGQDAGLIGPALFTMLLVMALVTTAATGPLLSLLAARRAAAPQVGSRS